MSFLILGKDMQFGKTLEICNALALCVFPFSYFPLFILLIYLKHFLWDEVHWCVRLHLVSHICMLRVCLSTDAYELRGFFYRNTICLDSDSFLRLNQNLFSRFCHCWNLQRFACKYSTTRGYITNVLQAYITASCVSSSNLLTVILHNLSTFPPTKIKALIVALWWDCIQTLQCYVKSQSAVVHLDLLFC